MVLKQGEPLFFYLLKTMRIKVYPNQPAEYVPDILFEDGTYKDKTDYIRQSKALDRRAIRAIAELKAKKPNL